VAWLDLLVCGHPFSPHSSQHLTGTWRIPQVVQIEWYSLKNVEGNWLIDGQEIEKDRVIGRTV
jgi:hypothetical protein